MFVFGRTVLVIVVISFCLPSVHLYSQSSPPIQELQQQQGIQGSVEPVLNNPPDNLNPNPLHSTPETLLKDLYPDYRSQSLLPLTGKVVMIALALPHCCALVIWIVKSGFSSRMG